MRGFKAGAFTIQSSNTSSHVSLPRMPTLSNFCAVLNPGVSRSMINAVMPFEPASGAVFAYTTKVDATGPFVILCHSFESVQYQQS